MVWIDHAPIVIDSRSASQWLMDNAGPAIRYRTTVDILGERPSEGLVRELNKSGAVVKCLDALKGDTSRNGLHGTRADAFENIMGKLYELGLRAGVPALDRRTRPYRDWMAVPCSRPRSGYLPVFHRTLVASFLAMTGYGDEEAVEQWIESRLDTVHRFAREGDVNEVYVPPERLPSLPKAFRGTPLVDPSLYPDEDLQLPWVHDINAFLHSPSIMADPAARSKVGQVIRFIISPGYQALRSGYGVVKHGRRFYMMGWSVHLPGYPGPGTSRSQLGRTLLLLTMLARSREAWEHDWFSRSVGGLMDYQEHGLFSFPPGAMPERKDGVWVLGTRMALEDRRRSRRGMVSESTFRAMEILSQAP